MKISARTIIFAIIIIICIFTINFAVYWQFFRNTENNRQQVDIQTEELSDLEKKFNNIFTNTLDTRG